MTAASFASGNWTTVIPAWVLLAGFAAGADLPPLPDKEGFAGSFAGVSHGALLVGGGASFPDKKPWDGGKKVWTDTVFVLEKPDGKWATAGKLPRPLGYGVSVTHRDGVICVGGSNADGHFADVFRLEWKGGELFTTELPALPKPLANTCGALVGDVLYVAGGIEKPDAVSASKAVYRIDLNAKSPKWEAVNGFPSGGRMLAAAAGFDGAFWLVGGVEIVTGKDGKPDRKYLTDVYRYDPANGWKRLADLPHAVAAPPSPMPTEAGGLFVVGCDDGTQWGTAHDKHTGFNTSVLRYDTRTEKWKTVGEVKSPRVTTPCVWWADKWVILSGEVRPGVRSPDVSTFTAGKKE